MRTLHAFLMVFAFAGLTVLPAAAARVPDAETALQTAGQRNQDILVFYHGSDWNAAGELFKTAVWDQPALETAFPAVCLLSIDMVDKPTEEQKQLREKTQKKLLDRCKPWNYPAIVFFDSKGRLVAKQEGIKAGMTGQELAARIKEFIDIRERRDRQWQEAQAGDPRVRAVAFGKGLDMLDYKIARSYGEVIRQIKDLDKDGVTGYADVYEFNASSFVEGQIFPLKQKKDQNNHQEILDKLDTMLGNPVRPIWQKQEIWAMKFAVHACWKGHEAQAFECLNRLIELDPKSDAAIGARHMLEPGVAKSCWMNDAFQ
jgi:hypothetical protein